MKKLTITLDVIAIFIIIFLAWGSLDIGGIIFVTLFGVLLPILNIVALLDFDSRDDLISLWIKVRKKRLRDQLEEESK